MLNNSNNSDNLNNSDIILSIALGIIIILIIINLFEPQKTVVISESNDVV